MKSAPLDKVSDKVSDKELLVRDFSHTLYKPAIQQITNLRYDPAHGGNTCENGRESGP
jgi:hypothetical protein